MSIEEYFRTCQAAGIIDHAVRHEVQSDGRISFYIHPANTSGETCNFVVDGNALVSGLWQKLYENTTV